MKDSVSQVFQSLDINLCVLSSLLLHREKRRGSHVSMEEQPTCCALCQDVLKDPVSTSCGHWFCRRCITSYWDQSASPGDSFCPQCGGKTQNKSWTADSRSDQHCTE